MQASDSARGKRGFEPNTVTPKVNTGADVQTVSGVDGKPAGGITSDTDSEEGEAEPMTYEDIVKAITQVKGLGTAVQDPKSKADVATLLTRMSDMEQVLPDFLLVFLAWT